jgi:chaperonin cofactor prefoldin
MEIALIIVGGIVVVTVITMVGDIIGKSIKAKSPMDIREIKGLVQRIEILEKQSQDREERMRQLESEIAFTTKLLEDKHT